MHHLESEHPVEPGVDGPVDRGHAADGDARIDAVAAVEHLPDERVLEGRIHAPILRAAKTGSDASDAGGAGLQPSCDAVVAGGWPLRGAFSPPRPFPLYRCAAPPRGGLRPDPYRASRGALKRRAGWISLREISLAGGTSHGRQAVGGA
ncbi:hypothetical protein GCM10010271_65610 [Streptomyces kurssanovii]|nr:hypothetical protein GCM10010271_65610 [Streptomyces kurssanovii]